MEFLPASLAGARDERADAFTRLLDRSLDRHVRLATVVLGDRDDAEDALADATLRAWRGVRTLRDPASSMPGSAGSS